MTAKVVKITIYAGVVAQLIIQITTTANQLGMAKIRLYAEVINF